MASNSRSAPRQPEASAEAQLLQVWEYKRKLEEMRALILYRRNKRKIPLDSLDEIERDISCIIEGLDRIPALKEAQESVRNAEMSLLVASDILEQSLEKHRSPGHSKALYKNYAEFTDFLLEAIECLDIYLTTERK